MERISEFQDNIDYKFKNIELLKNALVHTSYANEHNTKSNEKLEFLGDAVLEFVISFYLYNNYFELKEGEMTKVRASVVCENSLYKIAITHNFSDFLYLGRSELINKNRISPAILADSVEAVIAAIYLDSGIEEATRFIIENLSKEVEIASRNVGVKDYKTVLQEKLQTNGEVNIQYIIIEEKGPDHDKSFTAQVKVNDKILATGIGKSKKNAEMEAAKIAIEENNL